MKTFIIYNRIEYIFPDMNFNDNNLKYNKKNYKISFLSDTII